MSTKHKLVVALQQRLAALNQLERSGLGDGNVRGEIFALNEELAYLARAEVLNKKEVARLRAKFRLPDENSKAAPPTPRSILAVTQPTPVERIAEPVKVLPAHAPQGKTLPQPKVVAEQPMLVERAPRVDRLRFLWERYCVHCDEQLVFEDRRYICPRGCAMVAVG